MKKQENGVAKADTEGVKKKNKRPRADEAEDADQAAEAKKQSRKLQSSQPGEDTAAAADGPGEQAAPQAIVSSAATGSAQPGVRLCCMSCFYQCQTRNADCALHGATGSAGWSSFETFSTGMECLVRSI